MCVQSQPLDAFLLVSLKFPGDWRLVMDKPRPYVALAVLCEKVLVEKDDVLTAVRIIDKLTLQLPPAGMPEGMKPAIQITGLIGLKSGDAVGDFTLRLNITNPLGELRKDVITLPVKLLGGDHGQNFVINLGLGIENEGVYWFDVMLDDEVLTRTPLTITGGQPQPAPE
jgi:hypothetical protein